MTHTQHVVFQWVWGVLGLWGVAMGAFFFAVGQSRGNQRLGMMGLGIFLVGLVLGAWALR